MDAAILANLDVLDLRLRLEHRLATARHPLFQPEGRRHGLGRGALPLYLLLDKDGPATPGELGEQTGIAPDTVDEYLHALCGLGLVTVEVVPGEPDLVVPTGLPLAEALARARASS